MRQVKYDTTRRELWHADTIAFQNALFCTIFFDQLGMGSQTRMLNVSIHLTFLTSPSILAPGRGQR